MIVRQSHAHAWSEVWLPGSGWRRVDPTSAVAPERVERGLEASFAGSELLPDALARGFAAALAGAHVLGQPECASGTTGSSSSTARRRTRCCRPSASTTPTGRRSRRRSASASGSRWSSSSPGSRSSSGRAGRTRPQRPTAVSPAGSPVAASSTRSGRRRAILRGACAGCAPTSARRRSPSRKPTCGCATVLRPAAADLRLLRGLVARFRP